MQREYRWQSSLTAGRAFLIAVSLAALLQALLLFALDLPLGQALLAGALVALLIAALLAGRRDSRGRALSLVLPLTASSLLLWLAILSSQPPQTRYLEIAALVATAGSLLVGLLVYLRVRGDRALLVVCSLGAALVLVETLRLPRWPREARELWKQTRQAANRAGTVAPVPEREFPFPIDVWVQGRSWPDDDLLYTLEPGGLFKQYYPDNPRGYFYKESAAEWALRQRWETPGDRSYFLTQLDEQAAGVRVHFRAPHRPREYDPQVGWGRFAVRRGQRIACQVRVRAGAPTKINMACQGAEPPFAGLTPWTSFDVGPEWQTLDLLGAASDDQSAAMLAFNLPPVSQLVEISDVRVRCDERDVALAPPPNLHRHYVAYRLNSRGHRDRDYAIPRPEGVFRIVCLGDSYTFGQGVHAQDLITTRLAEQLNEQADAAGEATRFEVINVAVCGYGTREERLLYERTAREYQPQLIVALLVQNDDVNFLEDQRRLAEQTSRFETLDAARRLLNKRSTRDFTTSVRELVTLRDLCRTDGATLVAAAFRHEPIGEGSDWENLLGAAASGLREAGIPWVDLGESIMARHEFNELRVYPGGDGHPNEIAHRAAADALEAFLRRERLLPQSP